MSLSNMSPSNMSLSISGRRWLLPEWDEAEVTALSASLSVPPVVAGILYLRGVQSRQEGEIFLESRLRDLTNPLEIPGIRGSADRVVKAMAEGKRICIYGDYDVDGVTATSLMVLVLRRLGADVVYLLPQRLKQGYGLKKESVRQIREMGADLLITVDNGISAAEEVTLARSLGMDVIITDHHEVPGVLPDTPYIVNPKTILSAREPDGPVRPGDFSVLSGAGLAFALLVAVRASLRQSGSESQALLPNLREFLDLVALGTVGDVVPVMGENRILVRHGIRALMQTRNVGLRALMEVSGLSGRDLTPGHLGFMLAPRINAAGRLGDATLALRLLLSTDEKEAREIAAALDEENRTRQDLEKQIFEEADAQVREESRPLGAGQGAPVLVLRSETWHEGVIGIVASRIVERYFRPAILITRRGAQGIGSCRSIPGFCIYSALQTCADKLDSFGGHTMAAGLRLPWDRIPAFQERMLRYAERALPEDMLVPRIRADAVLDSGKISEPIMQGIEKLQPFGLGNPEPVFFSENVSVMNPLRAGENHLRFQIPAGRLRIQAIGFGMQEHLPLLEKEGRADLLYHLRYNTYNGVRSIQAVIVDMRLPEN